MQDVLDFETNFEDRFCEILEAVDIAPHKRRSASTATTPFVDVLVEIGAAGEHEVLRVNGTTEYDYYAAKASFAVVTERTENNSAHRDIVSSLRYIFLRSNLNFNHEFYEIVHMKPDGSSYEIVEGLDVTELTYDLVFRIKPEVFR